MIFYHYIFLFFLIALVWRNYHLFFRKEKKKIREGFGYGYESLDNCLDQGYPTSFCKRVPLEACVSNCPLGTFMPKTFNVM